MSKSAAKINIFPTPLSEESKEFAAKELRETPEIVEQALEELRALLKDDKTIYFRDDDEFLMYFLRPCKFYAKSAYELMKRIAEFRKTYAKILDDLKPEDEEEALCNHEVVNVVVDRDQKGRRILIVNCGAKWDPSKVSSDSIFRMFYLIHLSALLEPETTVRGVVVIMDFDGLSRKQVMGLSISFSQLLLTFIQQAMPLRLKEVHIVKQPFIFNLVWNVFKPFIGKKLNNRIFFHGSKMDSLHKHLDPQFLPEDYKGKLPAIDYSGKDWYPILVGIRDKIVEWNNYGYRKQE